MHQISSHFPAAGRREKFSTGLTRPNPGPIFPMQEATEEMEVCTSTPNPESRMMPIANIPMQRDRNPIQDLKSVVTGIYSNRQDGVNPLVA